MNCVVHALPEESLADMSLLSNSNRPLDSVYNSGEVSLKDSMVSLSMYRYQ